MNERGGSGFLAFLLVAAAIYYGAKYWPITIVAAVIFVLYKVGPKLYWRWHNHHYRAQARERLRVRRLIRNATREHALVQEGKLDGVYGDFQPPPETRGIGIWLTDDR